MAKTIKIKKGEWIEHGFSLLPKKDIFFRVRKNLKKNDYIAHNSRLRISVNIIDPYNLLNDDFNLLLIKQAVAVKYMHADECTAKIKRLIEDHFHVIW